LGFKLREPKAKQKKNIRWALEMQTKRKKGFYQPAKEKKLGAKVKNGREGVVSKG